MNLDDFELDAEVKDKILALHDQDVKGLKDKNSDLIGRLEKQKREHEDYVLDQAKKEEDAKVDLAKKQGDIDNYQKALDERDERLKSLTDEIKQKDQQIIVDSGVSEFMKNIKPDDAAAQMYMKQKFLDSVDVVDGQLKPKDVTMDIATLTTSLLEDKAHENYVTANVGSGTGSAGSNGSGSASTEKSAAEILYK